MTMSWGRRAVFWLAALSVVDHTVGKITFVLSNYQSQLTLLVKTLLTESLSHCYTNKVLLWVATKFDTVKIK